MQVLRTGFVFLQIWVLASATPGIAGAQTPVTPGISGSVARSVEVELAQTSRTARESDPLFNGAAIGAGVAIATGLFLCTRTEPWDNCRDDVDAMLKIGAIGAAIGIAVDALIRDRSSETAEVTNRPRVSVASVAGRRSRAVQLSLAF